MHSLIFSELREFVAATLTPSAEAALGPAPVSAEQRSAEALVCCIEAVAAEIGVAPADVERRFGAYLFGRFAALYPIILVDALSALEVLSELDGKVHAEVRRLHPDAEFPSFTHRRLGTDRLELHYRSARPFASLAEGLIQGCVAHFGERLTVRRLDPGGDGKDARFVVSRPRRAVKAPAA